MHSKRFLLLHFTHTELFEGPELVFVDGAALEGLPLRISRRSELKRVSRGISGQRRSRTH